MQGMVPPVPDIISAMQETVPVGRHVLADAALSEPQALAAGLRAQRGGPRVYAIRDLGWPASLA